MSHNQVAMTELSAALQHVLADARLAQTAEIVPLDRALGRILAQDASAPIDVPPWDNSAVDGFALHHADVVAPPCRLHLQQRIAAGQLGEELRRGCAARIFTGAPIPPGADTIVMQENVSWHDDILEVPAAPLAKQNIRPRGQDISRGSILLQAGRRLRAQDLGVLASVGIAEVGVLPRLRVGMLSTGDELCEPGQPLGEGQIYNSNRYTLLGLLQTLGYECRDYGIAADTLEATKNLLSSAAAECDVLITTGGVSVGEEDYVKTAVEELGELKLWKLAIKPGKPLAYGRVQGIPIFGLPGNPAAVFVTFGLVVKPYLYALQNIDVPAWRSRRVQAGFDWDVAGKRQEYLRGTLSIDAAGDDVVDIFANQSSGVLSLISRADCLVVMPIGATCRRGDRVEVITMQDWLA